jgi:hypothetical protein
MTQAITLSRIDGWLVGTHGFEDEAHRVLDTELAKKLGFGRPRDIRKLITKLVDGGELCGIQTRDAVARVDRRGRGSVEIASTEYWLTLEEALFVTAKSETATANAILKEVIAVFLKAQKDATRKLSQQVGYIARQLLAENPCDWDLMWPEEFVAAICKLDGVTWLGGAQPRFIASTYERIYRKLLGDDAYEQLKGSHGPPQHGENHHQWLSPLARTSLRKEIPKIVLLAKQARDKAEFWARFDHEYAKSMLQLDFFGARSRKPKSDDDGGSK